MNGWSPGGLRQDICAPLSEANAVVVLFAGALGDFVLALPALRLLRQRHGGSPLALAVRRPLAALAERTVCADRVTALDDHAMAAFLGGDVPPAWWPEMPRVYSWFGADDVTIRARLGARAVGTAFFRVERGEGSVHAACAYAAAIGEVRTWPELLGLGAIPASQPVPAARRRTLVLHRGAGASAKRWCPAAFADVATWWRSAGGEVTELLGPAEAEMESLPGVEVRRNLPLGAMTEVLARADAYVGNDSGPSHVAGALGVSGVVLFGPTDPARWRPLSTRLEVVRAQPASLGLHGFSDPPASAVIERLARGLP